MVKTALAAPDPADRRVVVLAKPGDVLLVGNAARVVSYQEHLSALNEVFGELGIKAFFFADDIDISKLPRDA